MTPIETGIAALWMIGLGVGLVWALIVLGYWLIWLLVRVPWKLIIGKFRFFLKGAVRVAFGLGVIVLAVSFPLPTLALGVLWMVLRDTGYYEKTSRWPDPPIEVGNR